MPRAAAVRDLDEKSAAVWLEEIAVVDRPWSVPQLTHAAFLLGRLAASPQVRELASIGEDARSWPVRSYVDGRLTHQILPMLHSEDLWRHPLIAATFDRDLARRMLRAADQVPRYLEEIEASPLGTAHGDACTNNLLVQPDSDDLVLIDYGFWGTQPLGFDLGQLLLGDIQLGRRRADQLNALEDAAVQAYWRGLREEGSDLDRALLQRTHALCMLIFFGLSAMPLEHLHTDTGPRQHRIAAERAAAARFILDLVEATG
jgi:thiamine kinase-like enzyme